MCSWAQALGLSLRILLNTAIHKAADTAKQSELALEMKCIGQFWSRDDGSFSLFLPEKMTIKILLRNRKIVAARRLSRREGLRKLWHNYIMDFYATLKKNELELITLTGKISKTSCQEKASPGQLHRSFHSWLKKKIYIYTNTYICDAQKRSVGEYIWLLIRTSEEEECTINWDKGWREFHWVLMYFYNELLRTNTGFLNKIF